MNELDLLIEKHYQKKKTEVFSLETLLEMVEDVIGDFRPILVEEATPTSFPDKLKVELSFIPDISVSELGWSDVSTTEGGETVKGPQRRLLEDYLKNVQGNTLSEKIASLEEFYEQGEEAIVDSAEDRTEVIKKIMS